MHENQLTTVFVRTAYPQATIVALRPLVGAFAVEIEAQVEARKAAGDAKVLYVNTEGWTSAGDDTDGLHPNVVGSTAIRDRLVPILQALL